MKEIINFNYKIKNFVDLFSIDSLNKMDEDTLIDNIFGCEIEDESTINPNTDKILINILKEEFQIIEFENKTIDTYLGLIYCSKYADYRNPELRKNFEPKEAGEFVFEIRKIINDYNFIIERIEGCMFNDGKFYDSAIRNKEICIAKYNNSLKFMNYGIRKLLAIYFPRYILPFMTEDQIFDFYYINELEYKEDDFIKNLMEINSFCRKMDRNTFDLAFEYYNSPKNKKLVINMDGVYEDISMLEKDLENEQLILKKEVPDNVTGKLKYLNTYPLKVDTNRYFYLAYNDKVRYKCLFRNISSESEKSIALKLINLKKIDELYPTKLTNYINLIQQNFKDDYLEHAKYSKKFSSVVDIIQNKKVLKELSIIKGLSKCHDLEHKKSEEDIYIILFYEDFVQAVKINAYYCPVCKKYSVLYSDFDSLVRKYKGYTFGVDVSNISKFDFNYENRYSILYLFGYNVSSKSNLSVSRRRFILDMFVENYWSRDRLILHIEKEIKKRVGITDRDMSTAISKWENDINYLKKKHKQMDDNDINYFFTYFLN